MQAGAELVWANDLDQALGSVIASNLTQCLGDDEPKLVHPLPALQRPVVELSNRGQLHAQAAADVANNDGDASTSSVSGHAPLEEISAAELAEVEAAHEPCSSSDSGYSSFLDQSPANLFFSPKERSRRRAQVSEPRLKGLQSARISHCDGARPIAMQFANRLQLAHVKRTFASRRSDGHFHQLCNHLRTRAAIEMNRI